MMHFQSRALPTASHKSILAWIAVAAIAAVALAVATPTLAVVNPAYKWNPGDTGGPVNTSTGNFRMTLPGIGTVGGRGPGLSFVPVYNSQLSHELGFPGDPINNVDPTGEFPQWAALAIAGALSNAAMTALAGGDKSDIAISAGFGAFSGGYLAPMGARQVGAWGVPLFFAQRASIGAAGTVAAQAANGKGFDVGLIAFGAIGSGIGGTMNAKTFQAAGRASWKGAAFGRGDIKPTPFNNDRHATRIGVQVWTSINTMGKMTQLLMGENYSKCSWGCVSNSTVRDFLSDPAGYGY